MNTTIRSLCERLGIQRVAGTFVFFRCETCGHEQHHLVPADDWTHVRKCAECGKMAAVARSAP